ncbi:DUF3309 family protein [Paenibacillus sp. N3.4]
MRIISFNYCTNFHYNPSFGLSIIVVVVLILLFF